MLEYTLQARDAVRLLVERGVTREGNQPIRSKDLDTRRADHSLPKFLWKKPAEHVVYALEALDWIQFAYSLRKTNDRRATFLLLADIFEKAIDKWTEANALVQLKSCFNGTTTSFDAFLTCLKGKGLELS